MTDTFPTEVNSRVKPGENQPEENQSLGYSEHTLVIDQVTRWDSGTYKCRVTSVPFVEIVHTLRVTRQYNISIHFITPAVLLSSTAVDVSYDLFFIY